MTRRACPTPRKIRHASWRAAIVARNSLVEAEGDVGTLEAYRCRCGAWHLGHPRPKDRRR